MLQKQIKTDRWSCKTSSSERDEHERQPTQHQRVTFSLALAALSLLYPSFSLSLTLVRERATYPYPALASDVRKMATIGDEYKTTSELTMRSPTTATCPYRRHLPPSLSLLPPINTVLKPFGFIKSLRNSQKSGSARVSNNVCVGSCRDRYRESGKGKGQGENSSDRLGFGMFGCGYDILYLGFRFFVSSFKRFLFFLAYHPLVTPYSCKSSICAIC